MVQEMSVQESVERLAFDGFVFLDQLCGNDLTTGILDVARHAAREVQEALGTAKIGIGSAAGYDEIVQRSPGRWDVPITPQQFGIDEAALPWATLISAVLGADAERSFSGVVFSDPGSPAQCWHTDSPHVAPEHRAPHALNVLVALHDIPLEMGPSEFARGSHILTNHLRNPSLKRDELIYQHAGTSPKRLVQGTESPVPAIYATALAAGAYVVFDDRMMHRGLANRSESTRYVAYFSYRRHGYAQNTHFESQRSVFDGTC